MRLLEPIDLGSRRAPNRILFGPHETNLGWDRAFSDRQVAYLDRRMRGGAGIVVAEEASVHESDWPYERCPLAAESGPGWSSLAAAAEETDSLALAAIGHTGGQGSSAFSQRELWAPSGVPEVNTRETPKVMEAADIAAVVAGFGEAASLAMGAGLAGVEVNAGQNSLVRQFLSGLTNLRDDVYGEDRLMFAREVLSSVRSAVGDGVVGLRLSCDELAPWAGLTPEAAAEVAADLASMVDYLVVVRGAIFSVQATRPDGHDEPGFNLDLVKLINDAVGSTPVFAQGSIVDVGQAEWAIGDGRCDGVEMTRAQIADPDLAQKAATDAALIRPCILCNQVCRVRDNRNPIITCVGEPRSGHETDDPDPDGSALSPRRVVVIGGGPAGLECARVAATRGHDVRLLEGADRLGGVVPVAAVGSGRGRLCTLTDWLEAECRRLGVDIALNTAVDASALAQLDPEAVLVLATGGQDRAPSFAIDGADVRSAHDTLAALARSDDPATALPDGPVLVWDPIGGPIAVSLAESLAAAGREVHLAFTDNIAGNQLALTGDLAPSNSRLQAAGVHLHRRSIVRSATARSVVVEDIHSGEQRSVEASTVIDAGHRIPADDLVDGVDLSPRQILRIGDLIAPRTLHEAVLEGRRAALSIEHLSAAARSNTGVSA